MNHTKPARRDAFIVFCAALVVRLIYLALVVHDPQNFMMPDSILFTHLADGIIQSGGYNRLVDGGELIVETERVPIYPLYLSVFYVLAGHDPLWPILGQIAIDALTCVFVGLLAHQLDRRLLLLAGLLAAVNLNMVVHSSLILTDSLFLFFLATHLYFTVRYFLAPAARSAVLSGVFYSLALLTRPMMFYFFALLLLAIALTAWRRENSIRQALRHAGLTFLAATFLTVPMLARNFHEFGHIGLVSQQGTHALNWVVPLAREFTLGAAFTKSQEEMGIRLHQQLAKRGMDSLPANPFESSELHLQVAREALLELGTWRLFQAWATGAAINLFSPSITSTPLINRMERPRFYQTSGSTITDKAWNFLTGADNLVFLSLMIPALLTVLIFRSVQLVGFVSVVRQWQLPAAPFLYMLLMSLYVLAVTGPVVGVKYRLPLEPFLVLLTAIGMARLCPRLRLTSAQRP